jgi:hypothetical protein
MTLQLVKEFSGIKPRREFRFGCRSHVGAIGSPETANGTISMSQSNASRRV